MSEFLITHTRRTDKREPFIYRLILILIIVTLVLAALGNLIFRFVISPGIKITKVLVESTLSISNDEILRIAGIDKNKYYFELDIKSMKERLEQIPVVREAEVKKEFPDTLKIRLIERIPLAIALSGDEKSVPVAFDDQGVVMQIGPGITNWNLPVISGLQISDPKPGFKLHDQLLSFVKEIRMLKDDFPALLDMISEIIVESKGNWDYELVFYFISHKTGVRFGKSFDSKQITYAMMVLDVLNKKNAGNQLNEIDFRTNEVVYKDQGGSVH